jgi:ParB family transcriptional regulator, chromosome partitioning protein
MVHMQQTVMLDLNEIEPRKKQNRQTFDQEKLQELSDSIKEQGVLQPILVRRKGRQKYEIIAGERRYRASRMAGLTKIPAIVKDSDETGTMVDSFLENAQREDLTPAEKEDALIALWKTRSFKTPKELDKKLGYANGYSGSIIEAREFREKHEIPSSITTTTIVSTKGLSEVTRKRLLLKVSKDEGKFGQVRTVREIKGIIEEAPEKIADRLLDNEIAIDDARKAVDLYNSTNNSELKPLATAIEEGKIDTVSAEKTLRIYDDLKNKGINLDPAMIKKDVEEVKRQTTLDTVHEKLMTQARLEVLSGRKKGVDMKIVDTGDSFLREVGDVAWRIQSWGIPNLMVVGSERWKIATKYFQEIDRKIHFLLGNVRDMKPVGDDAN